MMVLTSPMTEQSVYQGFGVGLTWGRRLRAQALPHSCCTMSKRIQLWEGCLAAEIKRCHRPVRGPVMSLLLPAAITAQQKSQDRSTSTSPPVPAWLSQGSDGCLDVSLSLSSTGSLRQLNYPTGHNGPMHSGAGAPCTRCFDTVHFIPNWGSGPRSLLWDFAIPESLDTSSDVRARGSVFKIKDWQLSLCKENDWLYLFLIHCYLVHMHNSCLILVVISRKYCVSLSQQNSLSRCPLKKKIWIWKKLKISPKGKRWEITRAVS